MRASIDGLIIRNTFSPVNRPSSKSIAFSPRAKRLLSPQAKQLSETKTNHLVKSPEIQKVRVQPKRQLQVPLNMIKFNEHSLKT